MFEETDTVTKALPFLVYENLDGDIFPKGEYHPFVTTIKKNLIQGSVYYLLEIDLTQKNLHHYEYEEPTLMPSCYDVSHIA